MKLYMHPVSMTSRPVRLFIAESGINVDEQVVDLFTGEHYKEPYASLNPNRLVPMLEDGDLRLTESSAIFRSGVEFIEPSDHVREALAAFVAALKAANAAASMVDSRYVGEAGT
jgi:exonuclease VII small subunit